MKPRRLSLSHDPIPYLTWKIALPSSVGMLFNTLFNFADSYFAGHLGTDALAALTLSFAPFFLVIAVGSGLSQGSTALIAHALGGGRVSQARHLFAQSLLLAVVTGLGLAVAGCAASPFLFRFLGAEGAYLTAALDYMNVIFLGSPLFLLTQALHAALAAQGDNRPYRNFLGIGLVANCILNPLLMGGMGGLPGLGVAGIAWATVLVQCFGCFYLWSKARQVPWMEGFSFRNLELRLPQLQAVSAQSVPAALNMITIAVGIFVLTWFVQQFGREAVAAAGIAVRIEQVILMPAIGVSSALISLVGHNLGAGRLERIREAWRTNIRIGVTLMLFGGVVLALSAEPLMRLFSEDAQVVGIGRQYLVFAAFTIAAYPILFATVFMMQGLKRPLYGLWMGLYRQLLAPLILCHCFTSILDWGLAGVWCGVLVVTWSAALFALGSARRVLHPGGQLLPA